MLLFSFTGEELRLIDFFKKIVLKTLIPCILAFFFPGHLKYIKALVINSVLSVKPFPFLKLQMSLQLPE